MPLRQTMLRFGALDTSADSLSTPKPPSLLELSRSSTASSETVPRASDNDTIVVKAPPRVSQLPTPSESSYDALSERGQVLGVKKGSYAQGARVDRRFNVDNNDGTTGSANVVNSRSISGETLVSGGSTSSLLQSGITALNLPWSMSSLFKVDSQEQLCMQEDDSIQVSTPSVSPGAQEAERRAKAAAKRAKMEENERIRQAKIKAADEKATRRSGRTSLLSKAGEVVTGLATSVLGKRSRDALDRGKDRLGDLKRRTSLRPRSEINTAPGVAPTFEGPVMKRRRLSEGDLDKLVDTSKAVTIPRNPVQKGREKKWLKSGLYIGQARNFDGRLTESKNKKKAANAKATQIVPDNKILPLPMFAGERLLKTGRDFKLPYDVFSPLPSGQPKPDEWRKTNKNVFIGDAAQEWRISKFLEHSTCMCKPETGCGNDCMNRFMYYECDERNCNLTEEQCGNRSFEALRHRVKKGGKYNIGVEVIKTADRGYGVRSNRSFVPHQIIVEYTGEIITQEEAESRMNNEYKGNECYYLMQFDQNMIIDATRGSIARFVNHSCEPNCRMEKWTVSGKPRMALFAGDKGVMTGDELTYDYNFDPFSQKNVQKCLCGSSNCRGVLGPKTKEEKKPKSDKPSARSVSTKRKIVQMMGETATAANKKRKIATTHAVALVRNASVRSSSSKKFKAPIVRRPSVLKRAVSNAKGKVNPRRAVSASSATEALIPRSVNKRVSRSQSVMVKAGTLRRNVVRTVRGAMG